LSQLVCLMKNRVPSSSGDRLILVRPYSFALVWLLAWKVDELSIPPLCGTCGLMYIYNVNEIVELNRPCGSKLNWFEAYRMPA
jgi:hypothetical protein